MLYNRKIRCGAALLRGTSLVGLFAAGLIASPALAQDAAPAEVAAPEEAAADDMAIEDIVVTAQKREQSVHDVPLSITAVTGEKLASQGITDLEKLASYVPGVQIGKGAIFTPINIRGIGSGGNRGFEQSVGMYIDGIYMGRDRQFRAPFLDLERVEVMRGPQGILFGKNTIAGAINISTANPKLGGDPEFRGTARWESETNTYLLDGMASASLTPTLGLRVAAQYRNSDGYVDNITRDMDEPGVNEFAGRMTLLWEPSDSFKANLKYSYLNSKVDGQNSVVTPFSKVTGTVTPPSALSNVIFAGVPAMAPGFSTRGTYDTYRDDPVAADWSPRDAQIDTTSHLLSLNMQYSFENDMTLTSVSGFSKYGTTDGTDNDFMPNRFIFRNEDQSFEQFSEELRLASSGNNTVDFIVGGYYEKQKLTQDASLLLNSNLGLLPKSVFAAGPTAAVYPILPATVLARNSYFHQTAETFAIFGEVTWKITPTLRLALGGRYGDEKKDFDKNVWFGADASPQGLYTAPASVMQENVLLLYWKALDPNNNLVDISAKHKENGFDPSVKLQWDVNDDVMAFATYSEGHKGGGFNGNDDQRLGNSATPWVALTPAGLSVRNPLYDPTTPGAGFEYDPEGAKSFEIGFKSRLFDNRMTFNLSAFYTKYSDLQVTQFQGTGFIVTNAKGSKIKGIEADTQFRVSREVTLSGAIGYLDFSFSDYANAGCTVQQISETVAPCVQDLTGRTNAYAPEISGNVSLDWLHPIGDEYQVHFNADLNFKSSQYLDYDLDPATKEGAESRINARIAFGKQSGAWEIAGFVQNLTKTTSYSAANDIPLTPGAFAKFIQEPRVFGLEARFKY